MNSINKLLSRISRFARVKSSPNQFRLNSNQAESNAEPSKSYRLLLLMPLTAFGLGSWQVHRLQWKKERIRDLELRSQADAVPLPTNIMEPGMKKQMEYKRVLVTGSFDHTQEILLGPRALNDQKGNKGGGMISQSKTGFQVITPFILENGDRILVNRGWVPKELKDSKKRQDGQISGKVSLAGYVRSGEKRPQFSPTVKQDSLQWYYCDVDSIATISKTMPLLIEADGNSSVRNGPIGGQTRVTLRNEHMQYIITWYSLSAATLYLYYQLRKRPSAMFRAGPS